MQRALDHLLDRGFHIVAEIIESELVVCAVCYVAGILSFSFVTGTVHVRLYRAYRQPESLIDRPHPLGVPLGQGIVDRDDMDLSSGQMHEVCRQGCY